MAAEIHAFEKAGLGIAPFEYVGFYTSRGPHRSVANGIEIQVGAPGQPMGTCAFCGAGIANCFKIKSADGKGFIVGSECVRKTGDYGMERAVDKEIQRIRKESEEARIAEIQRRFAAGELSDLLLGLRSPSGIGASAMSWFDWMMRHAGHSGKMRVVRFVEKNEKVRAGELVGAAS